MKSEGVKIKPTDLVKPNPFPGIDVQAMSVRQVVGSGGAYGGCIQTLVTCYSDTDLPG